MAVHEVSLAQKDDAPEVNLSEVQANPLVENSLADRASKFSQAWPESDNKPSYADIKTGLAAGNEHDLRTRLSTEVEMRDRQTKLNMIGDMAKYKAANSETDINQAEQDFINYQPDSMRYDPNGIMEHEFARKFVSNVLGKTDDPNHPFNVSQTSIPSVFSHDTDFQSEVLSKNAALTTRKQDVDSQLSSEGWLSWGLQEAKGVASIWRASDIAGAAPDTFTTRFQPGTMLDEKLQNLWNLPYQQFVPALDQFLAPLDPMEKSQVLEQALTFSGTQSMMSNLGAIADVSMAAEFALKAGLVGGKLISGIGAGVIKAATKEQIAAVAKGIAEHREALASLVKAPEAGPANPQQILERSGDILGAAEIGVIQRLTRAFPLGSAADKIDLAREVPGLFNFLPRLADVGNFSREAMQRLTQAFIGRADALTTMLGEAKGTALNRLPETALGKAFNLAEADLRDRFTGPANAILDVRHYFDSQAGVYRIEARVVKVGEGEPARVSQPAPTTPLLPQNSTLGRLYGMANQKPTIEISMGRPDATFFENPDEARAYGEWYGLKPDQYSVEPQGNGYYLSIKKAVDETKGPVRDLLTVDTENHDPISNANTLFGGLRSAQDLLAPLQRNNRHLALMAPNRAKEIIQKVADTITGLSRRERKELGQLAAVGRDMDNPDNPAQRGYFFKTLGEFDQAFMSLHQKPPTEGQANAYFAYTDLSNTEYFMRNFSLLRDKERQGIERLKFYYHDGQQAGMESPTFEGRKVDDLPWGNAQEFHVLRVHEDGKPEVLTSRSGLEQEKDLIKSGRLRVLQVANPPGRPLAELAENKLPIHFVLADKYDYKPLSYEQIQNNPGGHSIYPMQAYVKQPNIQKGVRGYLHYLSDKTIFNFNTMRQAEEKASILDEARIALRDGRDAEIPAILAKGVPMTTGQLKALFSESGHLSLEHPIVATRAGQRSIDGTYQGKVLKTLETYNPEGEKLRDEMYSSYNLYNSLDKEFLQDKDAVLPTIRKGEKEGDPLFQLNPSKQLDPFAALQRGLGGAIRQRWLNDYKTSAIEQWIEMYKGLFSSGKTAYIRGNPLYFFFNADLKDTLGTHGEVQKALAVRNNIINFLGVQTKIGANLDWLRWKMVDQIYSALPLRYGEKFANSDFVTNFLTPGKIDPARYMRNIGFHLVIGLFNPMRYLLHASYATHVVAIAGPKLGYQGMVASGLLQYMTMHGWSEDEQLINHVGGMASRMGFGDPAEFKEMYLALRDSGWGLVGNETAWKQDVFDPKLIKTPVGKFLDAGTWFFRKGEQFSRLSAFAAAYKEWKAVNPIAELNSKALGKILTRADDLSINMTRASSAGWQRGWTGVVAQFKTYNIRFMEQVLPGLFGQSNRITQAQALRAVTVYSLLYGIPATAGGVLGFVPAYQMLQKAAFDNGVNLHDSWKGLFNDGILSSAVAFTSHLFGGNRAYDIPERYGAYADSDVYDAVTQSKGLMDLLAGPSGEMIASAARALYPGVSAFVHWSQGKADEYPVRPQDFLDAARHIGSVSSGFKMIMASVTGKYYALNNELVADNLDAIDGLVMGLTGTMPREITDATLLRQTAQNDQAYQKKWGDQYVEDVTQAMRSFQAGQIEIGRQYLQRAKTDQVAGDFNPKQILELNHRSMTRDNFSVVNQSREDFYKYSPPSKKAARQEMIQNMGGQ